METRIRTYNRLEPAFGIIRAVGLQTLVVLTGLDARTVRRWAKPKATGGTGGTIPTKYQPAILAHAKRAGLALSEASFFPRDLSRGQRARTQAEPVAA